MKWQKQSEHLALSDAGYKVARFTVGDSQVYRASIRGEFIGSPQDSFEAARSVCENHQSIMGSEWE